MGLRFGLDIRSDEYRIALHGDATNVRLFVGDIEIDISTEKQCKFET